MDLLLIFRRMMLIVLCLNFIYMPLHLVAQQKIPFGKQRKLVPSHYLF